MYRPATYAKALLCIGAALVVSYCITELLQRNKPRHAGQHETHFVLRLPASRGNKTKMKMMENKEKFSERTSKLTEEVKARLDGNSSWTEKIALGLKVVYASLDHCKKPEYLPEPKALCFEVSIPNRHHRDIPLQEVRCLSNNYLLGIRKCGTTDVIKWFQYHDEKTMVLVKGHRILSVAVKCPEVVYAHEALPRYPQQHDLMNYAPGDILYSKVSQQNSTHLVIQTTFQHIAFLSSPTKSKFLITLRNPTHRLISYLYHAHEQKWIYRAVSKSAFGGTFIHSIIVDLIAKLFKCLDEHGEMACVFMYDSVDGKLQAAIQHGFYVIYLGELFKFVPRENVYVNQLEEYSKDQIGQATKMMKFFGKTLVVTEEELKTAKKHMNEGTDHNVLPETIELLDKLYRPYNQRLATLLEDRKWIYNQSSL